MTDAGLGGQGGEACGSAAVPNWVTVSGQRLYDIVMLRKIHREGTIAASVVAACSLAFLVALITTGSSGSQPAAVLASTAFLVVFTALAVRSGIKWRGYGREYMAALASCGPPEITELSRRVREAEVSGNTRERGILEAGLARAADRTARDILNGGPLD